MLLELADSLNSILQCIMLVLLPNYCINNKYKKSKLELISYIFVLWIIIQIVTIVLGNSSLGAIIIHITIILLGIIAFREDSLSVIIPLSLIQLCIVVTLLLCRTIFFRYIQHLVLPEHIDLLFFAILYVPQYIMTILILANKKKFLQFYKIIRSKNLSTFSFIIITIIGQFILFYNNGVHDVDTLVLKEIIFILLSIFLIFLTVYFANIEKKAKEITMLNNALEEKIIELKKLKHDYGAQISYLYGAHLMGKHDKLGELLKDIINGHDNIISEVAISNDDSAISLIVNGIDHKGINVIIDEQAPILESSLSEVDLQKIISNIVRNAVTVMNGKGIITIRTYYSPNNLIIEIQNTGPKIDDDIIDKIFNLGFTTKDNQEKNHGLGLAIVKDIIEKSNGSINVSSNYDTTDFTIKLPKRNS